MSDDLQDPLKSSETALSDPLFLEMPKHLRLFATFSGLIQLLDMRQD
jgi:hypothetical protein